MDIKLNDILRIGGYVSDSSISVAFVDFHNKKLIESSFVEQYIDSNKSLEEIIYSWKKAIFCFIPINKENCIINLAIPGPFNYNKGISLIKRQNKFQALYGHNVKVLLAEELGLSVSQITLNNDAACFLFGEAESGHIKGNNVIGITLGMGLGSAHHLDKNIKNADLWKMRFLDGIAEDYISTKWLIERWKVISGIEVSTLEEILFTNHNKIATLFDEFAKNLSDFLYLFIKKKHPTAVVLGGDIIKYADLFFLKTQKYLYDKMGISIPISKSENWQYSTIVGAVFGFNS